MQSSNYIENFDINYGNLCSKQENTCTYVCILYNIIDVYAKCHFHVNKLEMQKKFLYFCILTTNNK